MKTYIITLKHITESLEGAEKIYSKMSKWGHDVKMFDGIPGDMAVKRLREENRKIDFSALLLHSNHINLIKNPGHVGCFYSHYELWKICYESGNEIIIFEDDVILKRNYIPIDYEDILILSVNLELARSDEDYSFRQNYLYPLLNTVDEIPTGINYMGAAIPDASGYAITPRGAEKLLVRYKDTYNAADFCINSDVCNIKIHNYLMGTASNLKSLTQDYFSIKNDT